VEVSFRHRAGERPRERQAGEDDEHAEGDGSQASTADARAHEGVFAAMQGLGALVPVVAATAHPVSTEGTPSAPRGRPARSAMASAVRRGRAAVPIVAVRSREERSVDLALRRGARGLQRLPARWAPPGDTVRRLRPRHAPSALDDRVTGLVLGCAQLASGAHTRGRGVHAPPPARRVPRASKACSCACARRFTTMWMCAA
jgi:hypothetical protein